MTSAKGLVNRLKGTVCLPDADALPDLANDILKQTQVVAGFAFEADDNTQRQILFKNTGDHDLRLISAEFVPEAAVVASDTNYSIVKLSHMVAPAATYGDIAASMQTTIAAGTGNWVANTPEALTLSTTEANKICAPGEYCVVELDGATGGTGVDLPIGSWVVTYEIA